jgi:pyruvate dehydrogenase E2 component (dihydrolipoamide acetyltransferase)
MMDFIVKATALAVRQVPDANAAWMETFVRRYQQVDVNIVMGSGAGTIAPVIRDAGKKGLKELSAEIAALDDGLFADDEGTVVKDSSLLAPGTISIHNLGMYGIKSASPIILAPQACAMALGTIVDTVVPNPSAKAGEDNWTIAPIMVVTLSCDHRVIDGAVAAQYLQAFKVLVENPSGMIL